MRVVSGQALKNQYPLGLNKNHPNILLAGALTDQEKRVGEFHLLPSYSVHSLIFRVPTTSGNESITLSGADLITNIKNPRSEPRVHSPKKATLLAVTLPGAGQIYNRKYWKAPIVYAGLGASIYAIGMFRGNMISLNDSISNIYSLGKTPNALLIEDRDNQRSRRDIAILCLAGVYVLQILDATVDAHFYKFNINDNIGFEFNPSPLRTMTLNVHF